MSDDEKTNYDRGYDDVVPVLDIGGHVLGYAVRPPPDESPAETRLVVELAHAMRHAQRPDGFSWQAATRAGLAFLRARRYSAASTSDNPPGAGGAATGSRIGSTS